MIFPTPAGTVVFVGATNGSQLLLTSVVEYSGERVASSAVVLVVMLTCRSLPMRVVVRGAGVCAESLVPRTYSRNAERPSASASAFAVPVNVVASVVPGVPPAVVLMRQFVAVLDAGRVVGDAGMREASHKSHKYHMSKISLVSYESSPPNKPVQNA